MDTSYYNVTAIDRMYPRYVPYLIASYDGQLIMRRNLNGDFTLLAHNQETVVEISAKDAKDFALWILMADQ
jgi:hypothetical protein